MDVNTTLTGERIRGTIDESAVQHIMSVLTDLYSDPELAIIREYATNALDAHVEAGEQRPIEITTPSSLSPFLRVKDYGVGMDVDDIRNIYSRYGTSTKRESNDVVGMLGLGCKSALTYTDQFTLTGVKDEVLTTVSVSRDEDGGVSFVIVNQEATCEPSGVEVIIPAKRGNEIAEKAAVFFSYWKPGTVVVNGQPPKRVSGLKVTDDIILTKSDYRYANQQDVLVMGNVPYPANLKPEGMLRNSGIVAWVPIGTVSFTPSREALQDTAANRKAIQDVKDEVRRKIHAAFQARIDEATTTHEAALTFLECRSHGLKGDHTWKGQPIPHELDGSPATDRYMMIPGEKRYRHRDGDRYRSVSINHAANCHWIDNFDNVGFTPTMRAKLTAWKEANKPNEAVDQFILVNNITAEERKWIDPAKVWDWTPIGEVKLTKKAPDGTAKPRGSYKGRKDGQWHAPILADTIDTTKPLLYNWGNVWGTQGHPVFRHSPGMIPADATIIAIEANRVEKFKRDFPMAVCLNAYIAAEVKKFYAKLTKDDLLWLNMDVDTKEYLAKMDEARVDDPAIQRWIKLAKRKVSDATKTRYSTYNRHYGNAPDAPKEANPLHKYPLVSTDRYNNRHGGKIAVEHAYLYLNAAYAADRKEA